MQKAFLATAMTLIFSFGTAFAQTPPDVLKPYKAYRVALEKDDNKAAKKHALKAWEKAEEILGDSRTTGDLALNYATIEPTLKEKNPYKNYKTRVKAFKRAIKLASFYEDDAEIRELERRLLFNELELTLYKRNRKLGEISSLNKTAKIIEDYGLKGSTFDADLHVLYARYYQINDKPEKAIDYSEKAIELYKNRTDGYFSKHEYFIRVFKGDSHHDLSKKQDSLDEKINAALEYQVVMQNLEGKLPSDHVFVRDAFSRWMRTRSEIEEAGALDTAEAAGLCQCWPFEDYKNKVVPLKRVPPRMPRNARRSGHVNVSFDVDENGATENIKVVNSTSSVFEKAAIDSVKDWEFSNAEPGSDPKNRQGVVNKITFLLRDQRGNRIEE